MKTLISTLAISLVGMLPSPSLCLAQKAPPTDPTPKTKLESFQTQTGTVLIKGYSSVGRIAALGSVDVKSMVFTNATTGTAQPGVLIEVTESGRLERSDRSFIDYDEIDALLKGLDYISRATSDVTKLDQFEATYKTKGDLSATTFNNQSGKVDAAISSGNVGGVSAYLSLQQLNEFRSLIAQAKQQLDSIGQQPMRQH